MATITCFEDLKVWQKARALANCVYAGTSRGPFARDFVLRDQATRAVISIALNIAEGFERGGRKEFLQFLSVAKGSCGEVRAQLYLALDQRYIDQTQFDALVAQAREVSSMLSGLMAYLKRSNVPGTKFK
jgi:four helix bundle protein